MHVVEVNPPGVCRAAGRRESPGNEGDSGIGASSRNPGYYKGKPVGWCSVAPRERYGSLERSPVLKRLDDEPVWSIVCFFVAKDYRGKGIAEELVRGAVEYVRSQGGKVVEAYPTVPRGGRLPPVSSYMGLPEMFERVDFVKCAHPSKRKVVMRCYIE